MTSQPDISRGTPGLADYFLAGLPDRNFGLRVWNSVDEDKRSRYKKWVKFIKQHMEAIELMEKREKEKEIKKHICRGIKEMIKEEESKKREVASSSRVPRVHSLEDEEGVIDLSGALDEEDEHDENVKGDLKEDGWKDDGNKSDITVEDLAQLVNVLHSKTVEGVIACSIRASVRSNTVHTVTVRKT